MDKTKILFVCHGNICRSPMAEFILKELVRARGWEDRYEIASAAVTDGECGNPIYPQTCSCLTAHGIPYDRTKTARLVTPGDYARYDALICMDVDNVRRLQSITGGDPEHKIHLMLSYTGSRRDVADPWWTGNFEKSFQDILAGCEALLSSERPSESVYGAPWE